MDPRSDRSESPPRVRCPADGCGAIFVVAARHLGRNVYCLRCGTRMTARPLQADVAIAERAPRRQAAQAHAARRLPLTVLLDNVRSLWNVGSIFRTADACGVAEIALTGITGCPPRPEISKTALGAEAYVAWQYCPEARQALEGYRRRGFVPVALEHSDRAVPLDEVSWPARVCLVLGNEVAGVSAALLDLCPVHAFVPMRGVKDSLNVAVAFGIGVHAAAGHLIQSEGSRRLHVPRMGAR